MRSLPRAARAYILGIVIIAIVSLGLACRALVWDPVRLAQILLFASMIGLADLYPIVLPFEDRAEITVSCAVKTAAAIVFGPAETILATVLGTLGAETAMRRPWYKSAFNTAEMTITFGAASLFYELLYQGSRLPFYSLQNAAAVLVIMATYFVVNTGLVTTVVALTTGASYGRLWRMNFRDITWDSLTIIPLGAVMATMWQHQWWSIITLALPLVVVRQSLHYIGELQRQTRDALIGMADSIDQRDPNTFQHSQRVAEIATALARKLGLGEDDIEIIRMAGRLHDLGKIGMSNSLLLKPGAFDEAERLAFQEHPRIGARLVNSFRLFSEGQDLILHHHEDYGGGGYPDGLRGDAIPLGSRVLRVADAFDAMTSRRVYRDALPVSVAVKELRDNAGLQFDPAIVDAMLELVDGSPDGSPWIQRTIEENAAS